MDVVINLFKNFNELMMTVIEMSKDLRNTNPAVGRSKSFSNQSNLGDWLLE
jgi:hypothetical protein